MYRILTLAILISTLLVCTSGTNIHIKHKVGDPIDQLNGVPVYYNGSMKNVIGRHVSADGYNFGLKWQCVEFVKRYYYQHFNHRMPNSYGHAKDFFNDELADVEFNTARGLMQYRNTRYEKPMANDIIVYKGTRVNPFGHIGIIAEVTDEHVIIIQQNVRTKTRQKIKLVEYEGIYTIADFDVLGWLRM